MSATGRNRNASWTPKQHHHAGRGDLPGEFREGVEAPPVVQHAEQADQPAGDQDRVGLRVVERPLQGGQPGGDQDRRGHAEVHGHAAAPRGRDDVHVPPRAARPSSARIATIRTTGVVQEGDQRRGEQDDGVLAHRSAGAVRLRRLRRPVRGHRRRPRPCGCRRRRGSRSR